MTKYDPTGTSVEVRGVSAVTRVNADHVCNDVEGFKKLLKENRSNYAFLCGNISLRHDEDMCLLAAQNGVDIDTLYTYGVLNDAIVLQSLNSSAMNNSQTSFPAQISRLMEVYTVTQEFFEKIMTVAPEGVDFAWNIFHASNRNEAIKRLIANDKEWLKRCMTAFPGFYSYASKELKNDPEIRELYSSLTKGNQK